MNASPAGARDGAFLALALADALKLGLPDPDYITMSPPLASEPRSAIDFQFNDHRGRDPLPAMRAWAGRFGAAILAEDDDPRATWHKFDFTHAGVLFHAYAKIAADDAPFIASDEAAAVPAAPVAAGTPVVVEDDFTADPKHDPHVEWLAGDDSAADAQVRADERHLADDASDPHAARASMRLAGGAS